MTPIELPVKDLLAILALVFFLGALIGVGVGVKSAERAIQILVEPVVRRARMRWGLKWRMR